MLESPSATRFAHTLLALKQRTGRGYRDLAKSLYVSPAALQRYCAGKALPPDFAVIKRLVRLHGSRQEIDLLYQLWLRAQLDLAQTCR